MNCDVIARRAPLGALVLLSLTLAACSSGGGSNDSGGGGGGTTPTTITLAASASTVDAGGTSTITATLAGPGASSGVTWSLVGLGSIGTATTTTVVYSAPATLTGGTVATLAARSIADNTVSATINVAVNGTPVLVSPTFYPLYQNVAYNAQFAVAGGTAPFTWAISAGTLPTGLALNTSTTNAVTISGTPTAIGSFPFTVQATDNAGRITTSAVTLVVRAQTACLLEGDYAFMFAGFRSTDFIARGGSLSYGTDGKITGIEDFADVATSSTGANLTAGTCRTTTQNWGNNETASSAGNATYAYAALSNLRTAHFHQSDSSTARGSGILSQRAAPVTAAPSGSLAFGFFGVDNSGDGVALIGRATLDASGTITAGRVDLAGPSAQTAAALTGNLAAPTSGRGTGTLTFAGRSLSIYYYAISADRYFAISAGSNAPRLAGYITRQVAAGTSATAMLPNAAILSAWGAPLGAEQITALGRLTATGASTATLVLDTARKGDAPRTDTYSNMTVVLDTDGRAVVTAADNSRRFVLYLDGPASGYAAETTGVAKFGLLEAQAAGPFAAQAGGVFVSSTQFGNRNTSLLLAPQLNLNAGTISGPLNGTYSFDTATGRGTGAASTDYFGGTELVLYLVNDNRVRIMGGGRRGATPVGSAISIAEK